MYLFSCLTGAVSLRRGCWEITRQQKNPESSSIIPIFIDEKGETKNTKQGKQFLWRLAFYEEMNGHNTAVCAASKREIISRKRMNIFLFFGWDLWFTPLMISIVKTARISLEFEFPKFFFSSLLISAAVHISFFYSRCNPMGNLFYFFKFRASKEPFGFLWKLGHLVVTAQTSEQERAICVRKWINNSAAAREVIKCKDLHRR